MDMSSINVILCIYIIYINIIKQNDLNPTLLRYASIFKFSYKIHLVLVGEMDRKDAFYCTDINEKYCIFMKFSLSL